MAMVVFLRGANVGGHRKFLPTVLAEEMVDFDVINVGAAGTFVVGKTIGQQAVRAEFLRRLPFEAELVICPARDLINLMSGKPFPDGPSDAGERPYVSVLTKSPRTLPSLPLTKPTGDQWQVKVIRVSGKFVLSLCRRLGGALIYPNEVVEKSFGVSATTRNWNTITSICEILKNR